jgi:dTDP-4-amino-4,6-dideoxygalactose transaminase
VKETIPFVDLEGQYRKLQPEMAVAIDAVLESRAFIQGPYAAKFEKEFAGAMGAKHGLGCANGTAAISLALEALGIGRGDEIITVSHTFFATAEAIHHVGATPIFIDIDPHSYTMDPALLEPAITPRTKAVIPVHLYGTPADMDPIMEVARRHDLKVIEDSAQAHLATYRGAFAGALADAATFSFYPGKNLGAYGDAGFVSTSSDEVAERLRRLRDHGRLSKYEHDVIGYNQRMDGLQAAVLSVKLKYLAGWTANRRRNAARYDSKLRPRGFKTIEPSNEARSAYHLYVVEVENRNETLKALTEAGIGCGVHYPVPLHLQPALIAQGPGRGSLPVTERVADRVLSLPMCGELTDAQIDKVCDNFLGVARP